MKEVYEYIHTYIYVLEVIDLHIDVRYRVVGLTRVFSQSACVGSVNISEKSSACLGECKSCCAHVLSMMRLSMYAKAHATPC